MDYMFLQRFESPNEIYNSFHNFRGPNEMRTFFISKKKSMGDLFIGKNYSEKRKHQLIRKLPFFYVSLGDVERTLSEFNNSIASFENSNPGIYLEDIFYQGEFNLKTGISKVYISRGIALGDLEFTFTQKAVIDSKGKAFLGYELLNCQTGKLERKSKLVSSLD